MTNPTNLRGFAVVRAKSCDRGDTLTRIIAGIADRKLDGWRWL